MTVNHKAMLEIFTFIKPQLHPRDAEIYSKAIDILTNIDEGQSTQCVAILDMAISACLISLVLTSEDRFQMFQEFRDIGLRYSTIAHEKVGDLH